MGALGKYPLLPHLGRPAHTSNSTVSEPHTDLALAQPYALAIP